MHPTSTRTNINEHRTSTREVFSKKKSKKRSKLRCWKQFSNAIYLDSYQAPDLEVKNKKDTNLNSLEVTMKEPPRSFSWHQSEKWKRKNDYQDDNIDNLRRRENTTKVMVISTETIKASLPIIAQPIDPSL